YFTSRPNFKGMVRGAGRTYTAARQLVATAVHRAQQDQLQSLERMTDAVGIAQHHDAITGTEKQHVDDDYCKKLHEATEGVMESIVIPETMSRFGLRNGGGYCPLLNESICSWTEELSTESSSVLMAVYNPLSHPITSVVSVPIAPPKQKAESPEADDSIESYSVQRSLMGSLNRHCKGMAVAVEKAVSKQGVKVGAPLCYQRLTFPHYDQSWVTDDDDHRGTPTSTLYFTAEDVPPMGSAIYR
ncbi:lysosomal alpha-mannosidase, putative, partial [Perkinsus marinus ATCC 50983]